MNMIVDSDGYFLKPGPPPLAHPTDVERFESEIAIYKRLGPHERILHFHGLHPTEKALRFDYLPKGDMGRYLARTGLHNVPYSTRLQWLADVAEGLVFLHSKGIVWVDATPFNMLLTDDLRVVLSDFGGSGMIPEYFPSVQPTGIWVAPGIEFPFCTEAQDRFAFGTLVFLLLLGCYPHCDGPSFASYEEVAHIEELHATGNFDRRVTGDTYPGLAEVIQRCWRMEYASTDAMLGDALRGRDVCIAMPQPTPSTAPSHG